MYNPLLYIIQCIIYTCRQLLKSGQEQQELCRFLSQYLVGGRNTMIDRHLSSYYYLQPDTMMICLDGEVV